MATLNQEADYIGYEYAFPCNPAQSSSCGIDTYTWLLGHALAGALATDLAPDDAAEQAHAAVAAALYRLAQRRTGGTK